MHNYWLDAGDRLNIAMEYAAGGDLTAYVQTHKHAGSWTCGRLEQLAADLAAGLAHMHTHKLTHHDIKPANVLVARDGRAMLGDFGLARDRAARSVTTGIAGTPVYMSPEMLENAPYGAGADVWALGVTLYQAAAGDFAHLPFAAGRGGGPLDPQVVGIYQVSLAILRGAARVDLLSAVADANFRGAVQRMLTKAPELRISSAALCAQPWLARRIPSHSAPQATAAGEQFHFLQSSRRARDIAIKYPLGEELSRQRTHVLHRCAGRDDVVVDVSAFPATDDMIQVVKWLKVSVTLREVCAFVPLCPHGAALCRHQSRGGAVSRRWRTGGWIHRHASCWSRCAGASTWTCRITRSRNERQVRGRRQQQSGWCGT